MPQLTVLFVRLGLVAASLACAGWKWDGKPSRVVETPPFRAKSLPRVTKTLPWFSPPLGRPPIASRR